MSEASESLRISDDLVAKDKRILEEFGKLCGSLSMIVGEYAKLRKSILGVDTVLTSIASTAKEDKLLGRTSATHREWRAVDCRVDQNKMEEEEAIRLMVNRRFPTGIRKMPRIAPLRHGTAPHAHVQITRMEADGEA